MYADITSWLLTKSHLGLGDNGSMGFWDWKTGHRFQALDTTAQPGSLDAEAGIMSSTFDRSGLRLICGEADKTSMSRKTNKPITSAPLPDKTHH